jgi:hypothetical protein
MKTIPHVFSRACARRYLALGVLPVAFIAVGCNGSNNGGLPNPNPTVVPGPTATPGGTPNATGTPQGTPSGTPTAVPTATAIPGQAADFIVSLRGGSGSGSTAGSTLVRFNSARPLDAPLATIDVPNVDLRGIDFRPANGQLYGIGTGQRLFTFGSLSGNSVTPTAVGDPIPCPTASVW